MLRLARRVAIAIAGLLVIAIGIALLVLPGPGIVTVALGIGILSLEFERPRVWFAHFKAVAHRLRQAWHDWRARRRGSRPGDSEKPRDK